MKNRRLASGAGAVAICLMGWMAPAWAQVIVVDDSDGPPSYTETGVWRTTTSGTGYNDTLYRFSSLVTPPATATWTPLIPQSGNYEVFAIFLQGGNRTSRAPYTIVHANGTTVVELDQTGPFSGDLVAESLGAYRFEAGTDGSVTLSTSGGTGVYIADAVLFQPDTPPVIEAVRRSPLYPKGTDTVTVSARVTDNGSVDTVRVLWSPAEGPLDNQEVATLASGTETWSATLPPQPHGTVVSFAFEATDTLGSSTLGETFQYTVGATGTWQLVINEVMASNSFTTADPDFGGFDDWVEIHNLGPDPADMGGLHLSDRINNPTKWTFPPGVVVEPGEYLVVWCNGRDFLGQAVHTNFSLSAGGEDVVLYDPATETVLDQVSWDAMATDDSLARIPDVTGPFRMTIRPTPGGANEFETRGDAPVFSLGSGMYQDPISVEISAPGSVAIRYTLDGSQPRTTSTLYTGPIPLSATTGLRARAWYEEASASRTTSASYFFQTVAGRGIPIMNVVVDPADLFDPVTGIYIRFNERGREWEREAHVSVFSPDGSVHESIDAGLRMHGGFSRGAAKKSFRLYFRNDYGRNRWSLPWMEESPVGEIQQLVLRAGGNDGFLVSDLNQRRQVTFLREQIIRDWYREQGHYAVDGFFVALHLNGQYWGMYNPIERITDTQMAGVFGGGEDWDVVKGGWDSVQKYFTEANEGDLEAWNDLLAWHEASDLRTDEDFAELSARIDMGNFMDFMALNIAIQNEDWPHNNWIATRHRTRPGARWVFHEWDAEWALGLRPQGWTSNTIRWARGYNFHLSPSHNGRIAPLSNLFAGNEADTNRTRVIHGVLHHPQGRRGFIRAMENMLNHELRPERTIPRFDAYADLIRDEVPLEAARWSPSSPSSTADLIGFWNTATGNLRSFLVNRPDAIRNLMQDEFALSGRRTVDFVPDGPGTGTIRVRGREVELPWTGVWFDGSEVELEARAADGSVFMGWGGALVSGDPAATYDVQAGPPVTITVRFEEPAGPAVWYLY